jgi:hypothetical protein
LVEVYWKALPSIYSVSLRDEIAIYLGYELTVTGELGVDLRRVLVLKGRVDLGLHGQALLQGLGQGLVVSGVLLGAFCCTHYY